MIHDPKIWLMCRFSNGFFWKPNYFSTLNPVNVQNKRFCAQQNAVQDNRRPFPVSRLSHAFHACMDSLQSSVNEKFLFFICQGIKSNRAQHKKTNTFYWIRCFLLDETLKYVRGHVTLAPTVLQLDALLTSSPAPCPASVMLPRLPAAVR